MFSQLLPLQLGSGVNAHHIMDEIVDQYRKQKESDQ